MGEFEVRELRSGEESLWLGSDAETEPGKLTEFRSLFEKRPARDPRSFLVALDGPRAAGRLKGLFLSDKLYFIQELHCAEGLPCSVVEDALARYLGDSFSDEGIGILSWDRAKSAEINGALDRAGFEVEKRKAFVARDLKGGLPECRVDFTFRSLFEVGKPEFLRTMTEAAQGDPFEDVTNGDPEADFDELVEGAGNRFDPGSWMLARLGDDIVGVVLPQEYPGDDHEGTLFYVAVLPAFRGHGYGRALHAAGLAMLAERGVTRYAGSTDTRNEPMLRVFEANGCPQTGTQLFYRPPAR